VLGQARGVALLAAAQSGARVRSFAPSVVKQAVTGTGRAEKDQVGRMVAVLLGITVKGRFDASDALAAAICGVLRANETAERLVLELKDKIKTSGLAGARTSQPPPAAPGEALLSALVNLGYRPAAAERTADTVRRTLGPAAPLEDQLREALRLISGAP